jgi:hypothetical protein
MKHAEELAKAGKSDPLVVLEDDHDFDAPEGPFYDESEAIEISKDEDALNSNVDDGDEENEGVQVVESLVGTRKKFNSELETLLWMNTAGIGGSSLPDRSRDGWLQLMSDDRYRLQNCLDSWKSARDMKKTILKSAVGEVRGAYLQEISLAHGFKCC